MIVELGHFALVLALLVAILQMVVPAWGARVRDPRLMDVAEPAALLGFLERLKTEPRVAIDIVRAGSARTLVYDLR